MIKPSDVETLIRFRTTAAITRHAADNGYGVRERGLALCQSAKNESGLQYGIIITECWDPVPVDVSRQMQSEIANLAKRMHDYGVLHLELRPENIVKNESEVRFMDFSRALPFFHPIPDVLRHADLPYESLVLTMKDARLIQTWLSGMSAEEISFIQSHSFMYEQALIQRKFGDLAQVINTVTIEDGSVRQKYFADTFASARSFTYEKWIREFAAMYPKYTNARAEITNQDVRLLVKSAIGRDKVMELLDEAKLFDKSGLHERMLALYERTVEYFEGWLNDRGGDDVVWKVYTAIVNYGILYILVDNAKHLQKEPTYLCQFISESLKPPKDGNSLIIFTNVHSMKEIWKAIYPQNVDRHWWVQLKVAMRKFDPTIDIESYVTAEEYEEARIRANAR